MIKLKNLCKSFDGRRVTDDLDLTIEDKKMTVIVGRSGEGKSVLLRQIIGLVRPTSGQVLVDGVDITKLTGVQLEQNYKKFGYVFQFAALLDSLTVFENVGITLLEAGMSRNEVEPIVLEKLALVNLTADVLHKCPSQLSGGMRKRVGLARTLMMNPRIILYDEPTTGLDPITSRVVHELMYDTQRRLGVTSVAVSHDIEIFKYADYVALLHQGKIRYYGPAKEVWDADNPYIYQFIRGLDEGPMSSEAVPSDTQELE